jgi:hypothetical protein
VLAARVKLLNLGMTGVAFGSLKPFAMAALFWAQSIVWLIVNRATTVNPMTETTPHHTSLSVLLKHQ